jgi:ribose 5-phosphate isomerase B
MKILITESDIIALEKQGIRIVQKTKNTIITPLAADRIRSSKFNVVESEIVQYESILNQINGDSVLGKKVVIGSDHTGFRIKNILIKYLIEKGYEITDAGTFNEQTCDYPDFAKIVAASVSKGESDFGILIDATGIPSAITANKFKKIRASTCYNAFSAKSARAHNNANILVVGSKTLGEESIKSILNEWLNTNFEGGRHQNRLNKISEIENKNFAVD